MTPQMLRWQRPGPGRYTTEFNGYQLAVVKTADGLWVAQVNGQPAKEPHPDRPTRWGRANQAKTAAVKSLMPAPHPIVKGPTGYCAYGEGLPHGWVCGHDRYWVGHTVGKRLGEHGWEPIEPDDPELVAECERTAAELEQIVAEVSARCTPEFKAAKRDEIMQRVRRRSE